jgi:hypothetical protein
MNKEQIEKQAIEEMAKVIETTEQIARDAHCGLPSPTMYAKDLYWKGYRKQSEGCWCERSEFEDELYDFYYKCSCCGEYAFMSTNSKEDIFRFCPYCGAKMKGGAE